MNDGKTWVQRLQARTLQCLVKGPVPSLLIAGSFAFAGLGAVWTTSAGGAVVQQDRSIVVTTVDPAAYGCWNDPDGDGHIFCDGSVPVTQLPAAFGQCFSRDMYGNDSRIFCTGTGS